MCMSPDDFVTETGTGDSHGWVLPDYYGAGNHYPHVVDSEGYSNSHAHEHSMYQGWGHQNGGQRCLWSCLNGGPCVWGCQNGAHQDWGYQNGGWGHQDWVVPPHMPLPTPEEMAEIDRMMESEPPVDPADLPSWPMITSANPGVSPGVNPGVNPVLNPSLDVLGCGATAISSTEQPTGFPGFQSFPGQAFQHDQPGYFWLQGSSEAPAQQAAGQDTKGYVKTEDEVPAHVKTEDVVPAPAQQAAGQDTKGHVKTEDVVPAPAAISGPGKTDGAEADESALRTPKKYRVKNRVAAKRCREKSKQYERDLSDYASELAEDNFELEATAAALKGEVLSLKLQIIAGPVCDCPELQSYIAHQAAGITPNLHE